MQRRDDTGLPAGVAALDRAAQRQSLDLDAGRSDVADILDRHRADPEAAAVDRLHQAVGHQSRQRLAHRPEADREAPGKGGEVEPRARPQPRSEEHTPELQSLMRISY